MIIHDFKLSTMRSFSYQWRELSLTESYKLRALAILMIIMHNFLHLVLDTPGENEFSYSTEKYRAFVNGLWNTPVDFIRITFSYLGHYGVQVFFFLSGYGALLKLSKGKPSWFPYVKRRLLALYPAILTAAIGFLIYEGTRLGISEVLAQNGINLVRQILGISNFIPDNVYHPIGPWWFIGVIVQFYLIAPLLFKIPQIHGSKRPLILSGIALASLIAEYLFANSFRQTFDCNFNHTILGHLDICALGMLAAQYKKFTIPLWALILALLLFSVGNWYETMWISAGFWMTVMLLPTLRLLAHQLSKINLLNSALLAIGNLSMFIFLSNGYLRQPLMSLAQENPIWWKSLLYCGAFIIFVITWSTILYWIHRKLQNSSTHS